MIYAIILLILVIIILLLYIFLLKREIKSIPRKILQIKNTNSNKLINTDCYLKEINELINEINKLIIENRNYKSEYSAKICKLNKMITNITHDLRTPLTSAIGYIDFIQKSNISEKEKQQKIVVIEERLKRLEELIDSFFEFSKIISSNEEPKITKINIIEIIENCIASFYDDFSKENRNIDFNCSKNKIYIYSNKMMLTRVFDNLLINALKHDNGNLVINVVEKENSIEIFFENNLNYEVDILKVFDEFYTKDISRTSGNTGLGLAIVKDFVGKLNGQVTVVEEENKFKLKIVMKKS